MKLFSSLKVGFFAAILVGATSLFLPAQSPAPLPSPVPPPPGPPHHAPPFRGPPNLVMDALDTNHDGILSAEEIANAPASLRKLDKNGDGQLTEDELRPPPPPGWPGGPPRGQPGPGSPGANRPGFQDQSDPHPMRPLEPPSSGGREPSAPDMRQRAPAAAWVQRPPPPLDDDPVVSRLLKEAQDGHKQAPRPSAAPLTLFDLLDTNHDGILTDEELRNAPAVLKGLDLKSIGPLNRGEPPPPSPKPAK